MLNLTNIGRLLAGATLLVAINSAQAATLALSYSTTASGTTNYGVGTITAPSNSYSYANSFPNLTSPIPTTSYEFYDDYVFTVTGATVNSVSSTISLGNILAIDNLQARLYDASSNPTLPVLGTPVGGAIDAWSTSYSSGGSNITVSVLNNTLLSAGTYVLELRGNVSGSSGGSYTGQLNVTPVPLPAAAWLMGSALAGVVGIRRKMA